MNIKNDLDRDGLIGEDTLAMGIARVGSSDVIVKAGKISELIDYDFGGPLHCIIIPSKLHIVEAEYLVEIAGADPEIFKKGECGSSFSTSHNETYSKHFGDYKMVDRCYH